MVGGPVRYRLSGSSRLELDGPASPSSGVLQPGAHRVRGWQQCSASSNNEAGCGGEGLSVTLELGIPEDSDGDGLFDSWERDGIDLDGDGTVDLDLPAMGANPNHKDGFLEIDRMPGHAMAQPAVDRMVAAFAAAPVGNPDGRPGVTLHVDNGPASRMDPTTGAAWGAAARPARSPTSPCSGP